MILLDKKDYHKVIEPLKSVAINNLFARAVVEHKVIGDIFVDNLENPKTFYVKHPYGMTLLFGDWTNTDFNNIFRDYALSTDKIKTEYEWIQAFPGEWDDTLNKLFGDKLVNISDNKDEPGTILLNTRVNFKFNEEIYQNRKKADNENIEIIKTDGNIYDNMPGTVVPKYFWDSKEDFLKNGIGFSLFYEKQLASTVFSSWCVFDDMLEIGIETVDEFRGKGFAEIICSKMIDYCITNKFEPIWSCSLRNTGSHKLAQKIGFEPAYQRPYYIIKKI